MSDTALDSLSDSELVSQISLMVKQLVLMEDAVQRKKDVLRALLDERDRRKNG